MWLKFLLVGLLTHHVLADASDIQCPAVDGPDAVYFPHETDCSKFYECSNGVPYLFDCPAGLDFNPDLNVCDYPDQAGCRGRTTASPTEAPTQSTSAQTTESSSQNPPVTTPEATTSSSESTGPPTSATSSETPPTTTWVPTEPTDSTSDSTTSQPTTADDDDSSESDDSSSESSESNSSDSSDESDDSNESNDNSDEDDNSSGSDDSNNSNDNDSLEDDSDDDNSSVSDDDSNSSSQSDELNLAQADDSDILFKLISGSIEIDPLQGGPCDPDTYIRSMKDYPQLCEKYLKCYNGVTIVKNCAKQYYFDQDIGICVAPGFTECGPEA